MTQPEYRVLIVDDEPDIHSVTRMTLKKIKFNGVRITIGSAYSGQEALEDMKNNPHTAVVLLDVVMEKATAGLDACRKIRTELNNPFVRVLLRTGQPAISPEREVIEQYDIDDYLPKAEVTNNRLYTAVRTAMKAHDEIMKLERQRTMLALLNDSALLLHSFIPMETQLTHILETAQAIAPGPIAILNLQTSEKTGEAKSILVHQSTDPDPSRSEGIAKEIAAKVAADPEASLLIEPQPFQRGYLLPLTLNRDLGSGWLYVENQLEDATVRDTIKVLATHATNALYSAITESLLKDL